MAWSQKIRQKLSALFPKASRLLAVSFLAIAVFLSIVTVSKVILKLQSHGRYERQQELNLKGITEADLRETERQTAIRALVLVTVSVVVLLGFWLLFTDALKLFKVMRNWVAEEWNRCAGRSVDPSVPKTGFRKY